MLNERKSTMSKNPQTLTRAPTGCPTESTWPVSSLVHIHQAQHRIACITLSTRVLNTHSLTMQSYYMDGGQGLHNPSPSSSLVPKETGNTNWSWRLCSASGIFQWCRVWITCDSTIRYNTPWSYVLFQIIRMNQSGFTAETGYKTRE